MMPVYLLHFDEAIGNDRHSAQHYIGYTKNVNQRMWQHSNGVGFGRLVHVARERGITFALARVWPAGDRALEKRLKQRHQKLLCPICSGEAARKRGCYDG